MESLLDIKRQQMEQRAHQEKMMQQQQQRDREHRETMMRMVLENQKTMFQQTLSQSRQGATASGGSITWSSGQPHLSLSSKLTLPEFHGNCFKLK